MCVSETRHFWLALVAWCAALPVAGQETEILLLAGPRDHGAPGRHEYARDRSLFESRLRDAGTRLTVPGMAYAVVEDGAVRDRGEIHLDATQPPLTARTPLRFASVTKTLTAVALMRAVDRKALSLDDSVAKWLPEFASSPHIKVRHLAAHVSEGRVGEEYVYGTSRFAKLGAILTKALKADDFADVLRVEILAPSGMHWHESPDLGAHAGLVSTVDDMAKFAAALQGGQLLSAARFKQMSTPFRSPTGASLPAGVGVFTQKLGQEELVWSFGQDDPDHSSALFLMLPKRKLSLVLLANTDELSNPFRLLMGDVRYSPFATAFIDAYAPDLSGTIGERERLAQSALMALSQGDRLTAVGAFREISKLGDPGPNDFVPHFIAGLLGAGESPDFARRLDDAVYAAHPRNRWVLLMSGGLNTALSHQELASSRFEALLALENQEPDGLATLFRAWAYTGLARLHLSDREKAARFVADGLATGVGGGTRNDLLELQRQVTP
jgi:CubicO group peptidase (beta-lactamase class C family)